MTTKSIIDEFSEIRECVYKDEKYSIRNNGAVFRHPKNPSKPRSLDNYWTFGIKNVTNGYMMHGSHRIHIIVASAFHGVYDSKIYVVDHIDTNRCNNRTENLRWLTRLENALYNPITRKRIEYLCGGDIQKFIEDPSCIRDLAGTNQDIMWMRTVSKEEARNAYERVMAWVDKPNQAESTGVKMGEWVYKPYNPTKKSLDFDLNRINRVEKEEHINVVEDWRNGLTESLTLNALQKNWKTPTEFPLCPIEVKSEAIAEYYENIEVDKIFCRNKYSESKIIDLAISADKQKLWVVTDSGENSFKRWALAEISYENAYYIHSAYSTFFEKDGAMKYFTKVQGKEWTGGDVFDDFC